MPKNRHVALGPIAVDSYPVSAWSKIPQEVKLEDIWMIVGPTVEKNLNQHALWKVFCSVYWEGLAHAVGALEEKS